MADDALFQLGMGLDAPNTALTEDFEFDSPSVDPELDPDGPDATTPDTAANSGAADFFIEKGGVRCAGAHLIIDLYGGTRLDDLEHMERTLIDCVEAAGATLLHVHLHPFEPNGGISGVAVLAESHISVHSWPERDYAAFDVFMCGKARPERCIDVLKEAFGAERLAVKEILRGREA
jgi:S-adenosylmethionine decarboxylase